MIRRRLLALLTRAGGIVVMAPFDTLGAVQDQAPSRREITITAADFKFTPDRVEVVQDDLVRLNVKSGDIAHSFNVDEYRIAKRVPPGGSVRVEFRADRVGTFPFYCNLTSEPGHDVMRGQLVVRPK
jgi:heme/copper-type cytochrome/quinol oxidase subunit 2